LATYELLDSGNERKLERFGHLTISRPCAQAVWKPRLPKQRWEECSLIFSREEGRGWSYNQEVPSSWTIEVEGIVFKIAPTDFGHLGIFPEQRPIWRWMQELLKRRPNAAVLNLFAYSGGATLAAAKAGAQVVHLDASKGMVHWARENSQLNGLEKAPIRWIVDEAMKFCAREVRRNRRYDAIILDPPTFGRGHQGQVFKIEEEIQTLLQLCRDLLSDDPLFVFFSCHTPGFTPLTMHHLLFQALQGLKGEISSGEMVLSGSEETLSIPSGTYGKWVAH
jgi:23S rRNA (cytosine1962-C5)-methyltransferase